MIQPSDERADEALLDRVFWRIAPLVMLMYLIAVVDRQNVGFAKLEMIRALHMSESSYGLASSLFFVGYLIFEVPSALAAHRFGARLWLSRIILSWGLVTVALAFCTSSSMFFALRFLLGVAEAGLYPGLIYYLTLWFPRSYQVRVLGILTLGGALGNMLGSVMGGFFLDLNRWIGSALGSGLRLEGWQWVFVATGIPAIAIGVLAWLCLPNLPRTAGFLSGADKSRLLASIERERVPVASHRSIWAALIDPLTLLFSLGYMLALTALYGVIYWLPTVIKTFGVSGSINGLLSGLPWGVAALALILLPRRLKRQRTVLMWMAGVACLGIVCFLVSVSAQAASLRFAALAVGTPCILLLVPLFWSLPPKYFNGAQAAASVAAIGSFGSLGGFFAQNLMPWVARELHSAGAAMYVPAACLGLFALGALAFANEGGAAGERAPREVGGERLANDIDIHHKR